MKKIAFVIISVFAVSLISYGQQTDWNEVGKIFNRKASQTDGYYKFAFPRADLTVKIANHKVEPGLALTSWIAFLPMNSKAMVMGDLVLLESEVSPVLKSIVKNNFSVTAIHNHIIGELPKVMYLHYYAEGEPVDLANRFKKILSSTATPLSTPVSVKYSAKIDWDSVEKILGKGIPNGDLLSYSFKRKENISDNNMLMPKTYGVNTTFSFQKVGDKVFTTGDFVLLADEVNNVIKVLTQNNITVTALHNHMLTEKPRIFFMHFWSYDKPGVLAKALKEALEETNLSVK